MISVIVVLSSAQTKKHYPLGSITISNRGEIKPGGLSDYDVRQISKTNNLVNDAEVLNHPRQKVSVWKLVAKALESLGHTGDKAKRMSDLAEVRRQNQEDFREKAEEFERELTAARNVLQIIADGNSPNSDPRRYAKWWLDGSSIERMSEAKR